MHIRRRNSDPKSFPRAERSIHIISATTEYVKGYHTPKIIGKFRDEFENAKSAVLAGEDLKVRISNANSKMGEVPSVSLLPFLTCPSRCRDTCAVYCYAAKLANLRPAVRKAYAVNTALVFLRPEIYWAGVNAACKAAKYFRFHVSGDVPDIAYFYRMADTAETNPQCEILCFTKRYEIVNGYMDVCGALPKNLHVLFSGWDRLTPENPYNLPETNVVLRGNQPKENWKMCGGNCFNCACRGLGCWQAQPGDVIAFEQH